MIIDENDAQGNLDVTNLIIDWANARGLITNSNPQAQFVKLIEEAGELAAAIAKKKPLLEVADAIGDMYVVMTIIAAQYGLAIQDCIDLAYNGNGTEKYKGIKSRKGYMTKEGIFVKDE